MCRDSPVQQIERVHRLVKSQLDILPVPSADITDTDLMS